ncbi:MAG TPA: MarR family transcriptional regulator [Polyangiaceae bacterium LLY-WYZ-15_(1-7)]|nr:MarR family transcriptional regulator [Polyangiaceae bacterium LLY-WYZ-15_(1-7)]HJL03850.1 MarR family transcriptional regulator [Polyangiaceae bacterium LLY-WYZ-15_(1-7)]HJL07586.1 MarR family transcriptional regulator [Polyangiaceae bacterium LLY-WYZ-15_(1-7)]HJL23019.1 MarR family transcriptional regulator [Polyangiaceae bacterium LLY-WYZ-15_(1-7)]HJL27561.1 MarR family transcriptional regulator [Polyangiaceae bacterium LLY-WYZ-15_(1-7)]
MGSRFEESILVSIRRMTRAIDLHSRQLAKQHELTGPQLVCLRQIHREEETSPTKLARTVSLSQATVTGILDRLERDGLVRRERSARDKRKVLLSLTDKGLKLVRAAPSPLSEEFRSRLASLPEGEQAMIDWILRRVVEMMEAGDFDASPLMSTGPATAQAGDIADFLEHDPAAQDDVDAAE